MLTSVAGIKNDPQLLPPEEARRVLDAAKDVLAQMPWFAVHEYISDSIFSMDATFGLQTKSFSLLSMKEREQVPTQDQIPPDVLAILREHNKLDLVCPVAVQRHHRERRMRHRLTRSAIEVPYSARPRRVTVLRSCTSLGSRFSRPEYKQRGWQLTSRHPRATPAPTPTAEPM